MESTGNGKATSGGFFKGLGIAFLVIILLIILIAGLALFLTSPGRSQLKRLEAAGTVSELKGPVLESGGAVMEIPEAELSSILASAIKDSISGTPELEFLGVDVKLEDETIDILAGIAGPVPTFGINKKVTARAAARIVMAENGLMSLTPIALRVGRLPLPTGRLFTMSRRYPGYDDVVRDLEASGITIVPGEHRFLFDPAPVFDEVLPGMTIKHIRAVRGSLRVALTLPEHFMDSMDDIVKAVAAGQEDLMAGLQDAIPPGQEEVLAEIGAFLESVNEAAETGESEAAFAVISYLEGRVDGLLPGSADDIPLDFGDQLPIGSRVLCGPDSYAELAMPGGHITKVGENSSLEIQGVAAEGSNETSLSLLAGKARVLVSSLKDGEEFYLSAQDAVMAVRGTDYVVKIPKNGLVQLAVFEGAVAVNDEVTAQADQGVTIEKGAVGDPMPIDADLLDEVEAEMGIRTMPEEFRQLSKQNVTAIGVPHVMKAAALWAELDESTQWDVQHAIEAHMATHPEIQEAVDEFFRVNGLEDRRREFEAMFE